MTTAHALRARRLPRHQCRGSGKPVPSVGVTVTGAQTKRIVLQRQKEKCPVHHGETHARSGHRPRLSMRTHGEASRRRLPMCMVDGWMGLTAGYRLTFADSVSHQALLAA